MPTTIAYSNKGGFWKTRYTWMSSFMQKLGRKFFTSDIEFASPNELYNSTLVWKHNKNDDDARANYYGQQYGSGLSVSFNDNVSNNKIYKSFSLEGTSNIENAINTFIVNSDNNPNKQFSMGRIKDKGGILYGHIGLSSSLLDGSNIEAIGSFKASAFNASSYVPDYGTGPMLAVVSGSLIRNVSAVKGKSKYILMDIDGNFYSINGAPISSSLDQTLNYDSDLFGEPLHLNVFVNTQGNTIIQFAPLNSPYNEDGGFYSGGDYTTFSQSFTLDVPTTLLEITPQEINGAPPRGQYAQADISLGSAPYELYAINVNYEPTDLDHSK